jgi:hypothetical protein
MTVHQHSTSVRRLLAIPPDSTYKCRGRLRGQHYPNYRLSSVSIICHRSIYLTYLGHWPHSTPEAPEDQRRIVLSWDTSLVLELAFTPSSGHPLAFDALKIPLTRSVDHGVYRNHPYILSLQILLVDALTSIFMPANGWDQDKVDGENAPPSLVDFKAEQDIIYLRDGKATVRFTLPCCLLDSIHRTGLYR